MTIVVTGGGSGGHITPILAVASELKRLRPDVQVVYIGQRGDSLLDVPATDPYIDAVYAVPAGKLRRYHGEGLKQLLDLSTQARNLRDMGRVLLGLWQSFWLLQKLEPDVIFTRGGFVSVPVALAGKLQKIPYITHDSDSTPSLANRIIARWAALHAVALPAELYPYPPAKTVVVGIPLSRLYRPVTPALQQVYRKALKLEHYSHMLFVTGGGNGAKQLNDAVVANAPTLLKRFPKLLIVHVAGRKLMREVEQAYDAMLPAPTDRERVQVKDFISDLYRYSGAADIIIARGGATNLAEFAMQGKACIIIPSKQLVWNVKNSDTLAKAQAIVELTESQSEQEQRLANVIGELLEDKTRRQKLGEQLASFAMPDATHRLAVLLLEQVEHKQPNQPHETTAP